MKRSTTIEVDGFVYDAELATIETTNLGFEDHGLFTAYMTFKGANWVQAESARSWSPDALMLYLRKVLKVLGVRDWSEIKGADVFVLRQDGMIVGMAHRTEDRHIIFGAVAEEARQ